MSIAGNTKRRHCTETCQHELDGSGFLYSGSDIKSFSMKIYRAAFIRGLAHQHVCICICIVIISFITKGDASVCYRPLAAGKELLLGDVLHRFFVSSARNHLIHASALIIR
jgi:hypothetical protein